MLERLNEESKRRARFVIRTPNAASRRERSHRCRLNLKLHNLTTVLP